MNRDKMKELLAVKVDSLERWKEVCDAAGIEYDGWYYDPPPTKSFNWAGVNYIGNPAADGIHDALWWLKRETYRQLLGVYPEQTEVLKTIVNNFALGGHCIHVSREDPTMLAYTPSPEDGARDKQVRISFGKLMRKLLILVTDTHIQGLEASHRSELDPTFNVARDQAEIIRVYTQMDGDSGCMRYSGQNWGLKDGFHPSMAYAYAGIGVAFTEYNGIIKSRAVIYENPDDPEDKRYVRVYGDGALKRKLERAGYKCKSLQNAKLKAVRMKDVAGSPSKFRADQYLVPYLDGAAGDQYQQDGCYGYIVKDEDCIRLIDKDQANALVKKLGGIIGVPRLKSTEAVHNIPTVDPGVITFECYLTKKMCNIFDTETENAWVDGAVRQVCASILHERGFATRIYDLDARGELTNVWISPQYTAPTFYDRHYAGGTMLDTMRNRQKSGFLLLSTEHGYPENTWLHGNEAVESSPGSGKYVSRADTLTVFDADGTQQRVLAADYEHLRKSKDYVATAPKGKEKALSHKANPNLVVTVGGRKCVNGWHEIVQLCDDRWDYGINVTHARLFSTSVNIAAKDGSSVFRASERCVAERFQTYVAATERTRNSARLKDFAKQLLLDGYNSMSFMLKGDMLMRASRYTEGATVESLRAAVNKLAQMDDQAIVDTLDGSYVHYARGWQYHAEILLRLMDAKLAEWAGQTSAASEASLSTAYQVLRDVDRIAGMHVA